MIPVETELDLSVVLPCHNEGDVVERSLRETVTVLRAQSGLSFEVVLVDDGSIDDTWSSAYRTASELPEVRLFRLKHNGGKGNALRQAFSITRGRRICFLDGDLDIHPRHIPAFLLAMETGGADIVVGSKRHPASRIDYPRERLVLSRGYQLLIGGLLGLQIRDTQAGIKMFKREALEHVLPMGLVKKYAFDAELLALAHESGFRIAEEPIEMDFRSRFTSGVDIGEIWQMLLDTLGVFFRLRIRDQYGLPSPTNGSSFRG